MQPRLASLACLCSLMSIAACSHNLRAPATYAFDRPELLADQLLWGVAHGVQLLAGACQQADQPAAFSAWQQWRQREHAQIELIEQRLHAHYSSPTGVATELRQALGLRDTLSLSDQQLHAACDSLPEALIQPRYDLQRQRQEMLKHE